MLESTTTLPATHISNPWTQSKRTRETRNVASNSAYSNPVGCCSAFAHILSTHPTLWIRAAQPSVGCASRGRRTTSRPLMRADTRPYIHRNHHSNEHPVGGTKIRHAEEPVSAAGTALRSCYLWPSHACSRHKLLAPGRQRATSVPPDHPQRNNEENPSRTARGCHVVPVDICTKSHTS
jgi:hypothetical protein